VRILWGSRRARNCEMRHLTAVAELGTDHEGWWWRGWLQEPPSAVVPGVFESCTNTRSKMLVE
jgi:hypothetical protein